MKKTISILLAAILLLSLCACGSSSPSYSGQGMYADSVEAPMAAPAAAKNAYSGGFGMAEEVPYEAEMADTGEYDTAEPEEAPDAAPAEGAVMDPEKIIYSASVTVETTEFDTSLAALQDLVKQYGGFVESSSLSGNNYNAVARGSANNRSASYVLRIPSSRFSELMGRFSELGSVPYSYTYSENITSRYYDTDARLTAYRTQEARLLEMMELAETVEDVITIEDRLTELRYQIESLQSTLNNWDRQVSYSSISVELREVSVYTPVEPPSYGSRLLTAFADGFEAAGEFFLGLVETLVTLLPLILLVAVVLLVLVPVIKKSRARRKAKKAARLAAAQQSAETNNSEAK